MKRKALLTLSLFVLAAATANADPLEEALRRGPVQATTLEEVTIRESAPEKGLFIAKGNELFKVPANTPATITRKKDVDTLLGHITYVEVTLKDPKTGELKKGWAYFSDPKKTQFSLK
jgi:hypothetical protein